MKKLFMDFGRGDDVFCIISFLCKSIPKDIPVFKRKTGSRYRMKDLLHGMLIPSANDCAVAVAEGTSGRRHSVTNTNRLLDSKDYYCVAKTGNGETAKYCFTGVYTYKGHSYVIVTLGSSFESGRFSDARKMMAVCKKNAKEVQKKLSLNKSSVEMEAGSSIELKVKGVRADVAWSSKNKEVATVDKNGKVTGRHNNHLCKGVW